MNRREFLIGAAGAALAVGVLNGTARGEEKPGGKGMAEKSKLKKAIIFNMLPDSLSVADRFKLARDVGFDGIEVSPTSDAAAIASMREAADKAGIEIHSIIFGGWGKPLSAADDAVAAQGVEEVKAALKSAKDFGATGVLVVPAMVNEDNRYEDAYKRSQKRLREVIPTAEKLKMPVLIENVWNNFLLSPIEFARYIDELKSPMVQAYFDVGNVVKFGWPQDWIRTLGPRIKKVHLKDFRKGPSEWVNLLDGDVKWPEVRKALDEVGYSGYLTAELAGGDEKYLRDLSERIDKIIAGGKA